MKIAHLTLVKATPEVLSADTFKQQSLQLRSRKAILMVKQNPKGKGRLFLLKGHAPALNR